MSGAAIRVLLVEDSRLDARRIQQHLETVASPRFEVSHVTHLQEAIDLLQEQTFQVILLDLTLPDSSDLRTVRRMLAHCDETPVVVLTHLDDAAVAKAAVHEGAQDYLPKAQLGPEELRRGIQYAMERQELLRTLHRSERRWRRSISLTPDAVWQIDREGRITFVNQALCDALGREQHELLSRPFSDLVVGEDTGAWGEAQAELRDTGSSRFRARIKRGDGAELTMSITATELGDGTVSGICRDISRSLEAQAALQASEARYASILESTSDAIITLNAERRVVLFNRAAEAMFRIPRSTALGQPWENFLPLRLREAQQAQFQEVAAGGMSQRLGDGRSPLTALRGDGAEFSMEAMISPVVTGEERLFTLIARDVSEREAMQRTARAMTGRFQALLASAFDLVAEINLAGRFTFVSPNHQALLGQAAEELLGQEVAKLVHPEDRPALDEALQRLWRDGTAVRATLRLQHRNGGWHWFEASGVPFQTESGDTRMLAVYRDITERIEAMEQLRASEMRYRLLLDGAPDAIWILTEEQRYEYVNEAACELFGCGREELLGQRLSSWLATEEQERLAQALDQVRQAGAADLLTQVRRRDGSSRAVELHLLDLGTGAYQAVARDVTAWLTEEKARAASEERYQGALEHATDGIWVLDREARITYVNEAASQLLGRERTELVGRTIFELIPAEEQAWVREALGGLEQGGAALCSVPFQLPDGGRTVLEVEGVARADGGCQAFVWEQEAEAGMLTFVCDLCERGIKETGYLCDLIEARLVYGEAARPRVSERGRILSLYMCERCAAQVQRKIHTLRLQAANA